MVTLSFTYESAMESIKRVRQARGLSLADVAGRSGLLRQAIARAERQGIDPRASTVAAIADALRVPVCQLFERTGHERPRPKRQAR
jgi:transcriptional regulator with XRE-family HTH domain